MNKGKERGRRSTQRGAEIKRKEIRRGGRKRGSTTGQFGGNKNSFSLSGRRGRLDGGLGAKRPRRVLQTKDG